MSFNKTLYRNANRGNALISRFPSGDAPTNTVWLELFYGQSNNFGVRGAESGAPDDAVNQSASSIRMLNATFDALVAASELINTRADATWEALDSSDSAGCVSYANYLRARKVAAGEIDFEQVLVLNGQPSSTVAQISQGTAAYNDWVTDITTAVNLIIAEGKTPRVARILYAQGERDISESSEANWANRLIDNVYTPLVSTIKTLTGQTEDPVMHVDVVSAMYTTNTNDLALEIQRAATLNSNIKVGPYAGFASHYTDALHYDGEGQRYMRQMNAKMAHYSDLVALTVSTATLVGSTIELQVVGGLGDLRETLPVGMSSAPTDYNVRVFDGGVTPIAVTGVTLDNVNRKVILDLADSGAGSGYVVDGSYYSANTISATNTGGQYNTGRVPITDSDPRKGTLSDSVNHGNPELFNPLQPFRLTVS